MLHLAAYTASIAQNAYTDVAALQDDILTIANGHFQLFDNLYLLAAWSGSTTADRARLSSATFRQINQPHISPVEKAVLPASNPKINIFLDSPIALPQGEEIGVEAYQTGAGAEQTTFLAWIGRDLDPLPSGTPIKCRFASTTTAVANKWTSCTYTLDQSLPTGRYALVNSYVGSTNGIAHRWILPNQIARPGALSRQTTTDLPADAFARRRFGAWGQFPNTVLPQLQVLCNGADASHTGFLELIKVA